MEDQKKIFDFKKPTWKRIINRIDGSGRVFILIFAGLIITSYSTIREGLRNSELEKQRNIWIKTQVRDLKNTEFRSLDEEDPPAALIPKNGLEQFREEFSKIV